MELDELKHLWRRSEKVLPALPQNSLEAMLRRRVGSSYRVFRRRVFVELVAALLILAGGWGLIFLAKKAVMAFFYQLILVVLLGMIPVSIRFFLLLRQLRQTDFSGNLLDHIRQSVRYYEQTMRLYEWSAYLVLLVLIGILGWKGTYRWFSPWGRVSIVGYFFLVAALTRPYVRWLYRGPLEELKNLLKEADETPDY